MPTSPTKLPGNVPGRQVAYPTKATRHCTTCGRATLGHPKGRCPDDEIPTPQPSPAKTRVGTRASPQVQRVQPIPKEVEQAERRRRRSSIPSPAPLANVPQLPSFTTSGHEVMERLLQPGIMDDAMIAAEDRNRANVLRWLGTVIGPEESEGPLHSMETDSGSPASPSRASKPAAPSTLTGPGHAGPSARAPQPLRTDASLPQIVKDKAAHAIVVDVDSILTTMQSMQEKGFQTRAIWPPKHSEVREGWLIVGRDRATVDALVNRMLTSSRNAGTAR